jgi:magnesium chelatase family protein
MPAQIFRRMKLFSRIIHQRLALSPQLDLPIALGMLKLEENNRLPALDAFCITGELALSGRLRAVKGVLSIALEAKRRCRQTLIVPLENAAEAAVVEGVDVRGRFAV